MSYPRPSRQAPFFDLLGLGFAFLVMPAIGVYCLLRWWFGWA